MSAYYHMYCRNYLRHWTLSINMMDTFGTGSTLTRHIHRFQRLLDFPLWLFHTGLYRIAGIDKRFNCEYWYTKYKTKVFWYSWVFNISHNNRCVPDKNTNECYYLDTRSLKDVDQKKSLALIPDAPKGRA